MLRVLTLGGLTLEAGDRPGPGPRARLQGLGLLARLAAAGERGVSREKLIGAFWPEKDERAALHSLSQALHRLRAQLGIEGIVLGTRILRLDPTHCSSDVADLKAAHRARSFRAVADLYAGPFLDGIYFSDSVSLEQWIEEERRGLVTLYAEALRALASEAAAVAHHEDAARWWRCLLAQDPLDGRVATEFVHALAAAGDEAGALREARHHQTFVRAELRSEPDARLRTFIERHSARNGERHGAAHDVTSAKAPARRDVGASACDELSARARQCLYRFSREGFDEGIRYAERAVQLCPSQAEAHATLGSLCILLSQGDREGDPRSRGVGHFRRAADLKPALSEARLWLAFAAQLDHRFDDAEALALEGIALDPDGLFANTVLGWVRLTCGLTSGRWDKCVASVASFERALVIHPRDPHVAHALAAIRTLAGEHAVALALLDRAIETERWASVEMQTSGALTLSGLAALHAGQVELARERLTAAATVYSNAEQLYAPYVNALTMCGLGDLERMGGRYGDAASWYMRATAMLDSNPALIGSGHLAVRVHTRLAGVFRRLRMRFEEERHAGEARELTLARAHYSFNWCWGVSEAELHYDWAVYHAECTDGEATRASLNRAMDYGWREISLLDVEPAFAASRESDEMRATVDDARQRPGLSDRDSNPDRRMQDDVVSA